MSTDTERIKIVHIITRLDRGGSAEVVLELASRLDRRYYDVQIVTGKTVDPMCNLDMYSRDTGIPVHIFQHLRRDIMPVYDLLACIQLYRYLRHVKPQIVHTHSSKAGILGRIAAKLAGIPVVVHAPHGHVFYGYYGRLVSYAFVMLERLMARITDRVITLTELGKQDHINFGIGPPDLFVPIPCGINTSRFMNAEPEGKTLLSTLEMKPDEQLILWTGRLVPIKGCEVFLKACAIVAQHNKQAKFYMVGDGPLAESLHLLANELGLQDRLIFTGWRSDIPAWMWAADIFVLSSHNEGLGRVLLEVMATRTPIVATDVGGVGEIIQQNESGLLVPPDNPESLAEGMLNFLQNKAQAKVMGEKGFHQLQRFDIQQVTEKTAALYEMILGEKGKKYAALPHASI